MSGEQKLFTNEELQYRIADLLATVYLSIPFKKFKAIRNIHDVFNHRVRAASRKPTLEEFTSKLCNYFGIQSVPEDAVWIIQELKPKEQQVMDMIYKEHIYICALAYLRVEKYREARKTKNIFRKESDRNDESQV